MNLKMLYVLFMLPLFIACERQQVIVEGLSQNDANEILVLLKDHSIVAKKISTASKKQEYALKVDKNDVDKSLRLLVINQLPKTARAGFKEVYPPGSQGIIPSKSDENARLVMALQGEIEGLLNVVPGVIDSRVMLFLDSFQQVKSASVAIIISPHQPPIEANEIKNLVAYAAGGMAIENVHVVIKEQITREPIPEVIKEYSTDTALIWGLLLLTILSLLTALYAFLRPSLRAKFAPARDAL